MIHVHGTQIMNYLDLRANVDTGHGPALAFTTTYIIYFCFDNAK